MASKDKCKTSGGSGKKVSNVYKKDKNVKKWRNKRQKSVDPGVYGRQEDNTRIKCVILCVRAFRRSDSALYFSVFSRRTPADARAAGQDTDSQQKGKLHYIQITSNTRFHKNLHCLFMKNSRKDNEDFWRVTFFRRTWSQKARWGSKPFHSSVQAAWY